MTIRDARPDEYDALASIKARAFRASYVPLIGEEAVEALFRDATAAWFHTRVAEGHVVLAAASEEAVLADEGLGDGLLGFAVFGPNTLDAPAERELRNVYVEPEITARGIGRALVDAAIERMRTEGVKSVSLGVFPSNVRAIEFYERCGFIRWKLATWTNNGVEFADQIMLRNLD